MSLQHATAATAAVIALTLLHAGASLGADRRAPATASGMRAYETRYYVIHTDLGRDAAREAELRMTRMAEEYRRRTRDFSGEIRTKLPFYLFKDEADYHAAGGHANSAGEYDPNTQTLMAFAGGPQPNLATWYTVQHEGFHQFADHVIGRNLPIWANEGLAEYFGESLFTGDGFVPGVAPPWRVKRVRESLKAGKFARLDEILGMAHKEWNERLSTTNYDHVWSLVQFLVHGDNGARRQRFAAFVQEASGDGDNEPVAAFERHVGPLKDVEAAWRTYWTNLPDSAAADLYAEATLRTLTSVLARATARRQRFDSFESFLTAAENGELKSSESDWLPPGLLTDALTRATELQKGGGRFTIVPDAPRPPKIVYVGKDGGQMAGRFTLKGARVDQVTVERTLAPSPRVRGEGAKLP
jgi:hypothetical protein